MVAGAIIGSAVIGAGASMMGASKQAGAMGDAAALQAEATRLSVAESRRQYDLFRSDLAPYRETGETALGQYAALYGVGRDGMLSDEDMQGARDMFKATPGYEFRMEEGVKALDRSAAARGGLGSGGYGRDLTRFGQGIASEEFNNYANRLAGLANTGQSSAAQTGAAGMQSAGQVGNFLMSGAANQGNMLAQAGTARASGYAGVANAASGAASNYLFMNAMQNMPNWGYGQGGTWPAPG